MSARGNARLRSSVIEHREMEELHACGSCRQPIHRSAVRCPRCHAFQRRFSSQPEPSAKGYREANRPPELSKLTRPSAPRALSKTSEADELGEHEDDPGIFHGLVLPHPRTRGIVRAIETAFCIVALPLSLCSVAGLALLFVASVDMPWGRRRRQGFQLRAPARVFRAVGIVMGTALLFVALQAGGLPREVIAIVLAAQVGTIVSRTAIRRATLAPEPRRLDLDA